MTKRTSVGMKNVFAAFLVWIVGTACGPVVKNPVPLASVPPPPPVAEQEYRIQVGDEMDIKFFYNSELNEHLTVRPDGRISLQLIDEVLASGLTPTELTQSLKSRYAAHLTRPEVVVMVKSYSKYKVFVDGEVNQPGVQDLTGQMTIRQCIATAGGMKFTARSNEIVLIRQNGDQKPFVTVINIDKVNEGTDLNQDIPAKPYDVVYVPKSPIANVNVWMEQYMKNLIPLAPLGFLPLFL